MDVQRKNELIERPRNSTKQEVQLTQRERERAHLTSLYQLTVNRKVDVPVYRLDTFDNALVLGDLCEYN